MATTPSPVVRLTKDFSVPAVDYAMQGNAVLGIRDAGKTYTAMGSAEQLLDAGIPIIAYDPVGVWKNLKIGTGKHKGYQIVVAGGEGSDIRLTPQNAVDIVRAAMKENISLVVDLYSPELINKSTWIKIVQETVDLLMYENKGYGLRHIFLEEAAEFIPQRLQPQHSRVYASIERLARMGRNARLGMTIINQRAEEVNKAILEICAFSLLHKQVGKNSLKSIQQWLELRQIDNVKDIIKSLPALLQGECWAIGLTDQPKRIQIAPRNTFHPDPKKGNDPTMMKMQAADVTSFVAKMNEQLKKPEVKKGGQLKNTSASNIGDVEEIARLKKLLAEKDRELKGYKDLYSDSVKAFATIANIAQRQSGSYIPTPAIENPVPKTEKIASGIIRTASTGNGSVTGGAMRMLKAAAMFHPKPITKMRMAALSRLSHTSGSFGTYLATLKREGLITVEGNLFMATEKGLQQAGAVEPLPTDPDQLIDLWCEVIGNNSGAARMLRVLGNEYPEEITREHLAREVEMSPSSGSFGTYLSTLKRNGLIEVGKGFVRASNELFN